MAKKSLLRSASALAPARGAYDRKKANRISLRVVIVVAVALAAYIAVQEATDPVSVSDGRLRMRAIFGASLALGDIQELMLEPSPVVIDKRLFGNDAFGLFQEGDYQVEGLGTARVFLKKPNVSYITIRTSERNYAISLGSLEKDQLLYNRIKLGMK